MATMVYASQVFNQSIVLRTKNRHYLFIEDFSNGVASVVFTHDYYDEEETFAEVISGCFDEESNFKIALYTAYKCPYRTVFRGIWINFMDSRVLITKENSSKELVYKAVHKIIEEEHGFLESHALPIYWVSPFNVYVPSRHPPV